MYRFLIAVLITVLFSCSNKPKPKDYNIEITISHANSYNYDLKNHVYTVLGFMKRDTIIPFNLSAVEQHQIVDKYYALKLDSLGERTLIYAISNILSPRILHYIKVQSKNQTQYINIEAGRKEYEPQDIINAKRINEFIDFTKSILNSKPEIKNAPESDVGYF
jgi:hypothetical protein